MVYGLTSNIPQIKLLLVLLTWRMNRKYQKYTFHQVGRAKTAKHPVLLSLKPFCSVSSSWVVVLTLMTSLCLHPLMQRTSCKQLMHKILSGERNSQFRLLIVMQSTLRSFLRSLLVWFVAVPSALFDLLYRTDKGANRIETQLEALFLVLFVSGFYFCVTRLIVACQSRPARERLSSTGSCLFCYTS